MVSLQDTLLLIHRAYLDGMNAHLRMLHPESGIMTRSQTMEYLKRRGFNPNILKVWESEGLVESHKTGNKDNSPIHYNANQIDEVIASVKVFQANNKVKTL